VFLDLDVVGECWLSRRSTIRGYPQIGWGEGGKNYMRLAHRVAWEAVNGLIPDEMTVDHMRTVCIGPPCIRPDHLRILPNFENARRQYGRDWPLGECAHGHPNSEMVQYKTQRVCGVCKRENARAWARQNRAKVKAEREAAAKRL
jgi:hypothetical protein